MPKMDGFAVLKELRKDSKIPVIVISALEQEEDIKQAKDLGANDFFEKTNNDYNILKNKIDSLIKS